MRNDPVTAPISEAADEGWSTEILTDKNLPLGVAEVPPSCGMIAHVPLWLKITWQRDTALGYRMASWKAASSGW